MLNLTSWLETFLQQLNKTFGSRVWFVGLQGSYARNEAHNGSDIDMVVILDEVTPKDIQDYHNMLDTLPYREMICGFFAGKQELLNWDPSDLFQFYHDTKPLQGSMTELEGRLTPQVIDQAIKIGVCNIYHGCVHNMLFTQNEKVLKGLYKSASFVVQAICYKQTGTYLRRQEELLHTVAPEEREILETFLALTNGKTVDFEKASQTLFVWAKKWLEKP